jgi:hypothetical protein
MAQITVILKPTEKDALHILAEREYRDPRPQAALVECLHCFARRGRELRTLTLTLCGLAQGPPIPPTVVGEIAYPAGAPKVGYLVFTIRKSKDSRL